MTKEIKVDIKENSILALDSMILNILLKDNSTGKNIIWATDNYVQYGEMYANDKQITLFSITGKNGNTIKPRVEKTKQSNLLVFVIKPKSLLLRGYAISKTILLITLGLVEKAYLM